MNSQSKIERMEREIQILKDKAKILEDWQTRVRTLNSFTPEEKCKVFDNLHNQAWEYVQESVESGYEPKDGEYYLYEAIMTEMLGPEVWKITNAVLG